ncbi:hypothetical protein B296_00048779 [Ensete ventricosum]|uniref:Uncharacterized protein n=1 Tax=Ensete ventricosum TaxID=4639 RepID=A0A426Y4C1_ENSVE|nr:hypothetical protein B296_00048779 [Ensete ventricosum]
MIITPSILLLWSDFRRVGRFLPDLKEDFGPGRIEGDGGQPWDGWLKPLYSSSRGPQGWGLNVSTRDTTICSIGLELSSYTSSVGSQKFCGIGLSWTSRTKGDPLIELSPSSSFDLTNSFWTSFIHRFISRSCTRSESVESEERVFGSSMLWTEVLMLGACRFSTFMRGLEGARGEVMGPPHQVTIGPRATLMRVMPPIVPLYRFVVVASAAASAEACGE